MSKVQFSIVQTDHGAFGYVAVGDRLVATYLPEPEGRLRARIAERWTEARESKSLLPAFRKQIMAYYAGKGGQFDVAIDLSQQPPFRRKVLEACRGVEHGTTASYAELARRAGSAKAVRAAGGAMANNPLPLVIPCHRILRSDGSLGGFSSPEGLMQKKRMLLLERGGSDNSSRKGART